MRTISITVHNNQKLEVFVEKRKHGFELWKVGSIKGCRTVLDHCLTHDDLEAHLEYAGINDLVWRDAVRSEIPVEKHLSAIQMEETIKRETLVDFEKGLHQPLVYHFASTVNLIPVDRKEWNVAKKAILGRWTDGVATVGFESDAKLKWSCPMDRPHPFNSGAHTYTPDWWNFASWQLHLMNDEHKTGMRIGVIRVDEQELHIWSENHAHRLAHVFRRVKGNEPVQIGIANRGEMASK